MASTTTTRRAVITGVGVLSPIGKDPAAFWQSLVDRKSGVRPLPTAEGSVLPCRIGAQILDLEPKKIITNRDQVKSLNRMMARTVQIGVVSAQLAIDDLKIAPGTYDPARCGVEYGAAMIHTELEDLARAAKMSTNCQPGSVSLKVWGEAGLKEVPPLWMLKYLPNMPACHVAIFHDIQGPSNTITSGDVASLLALGEAYRILQRDLVDFYLVGGCESKLNPLNFVRQSMFQPLTTTRNNDPEHALRPFDVDRDGTVLAEAGVTFGLEDLDHARRRGAKIYAEVVGFASGFDRLKDGVVMARVMRRALADAGITPADVDHVNANGLGTQEADLWEAAAIREVFGKSTPVWGLKGYLGAAGPAGSVVELLGSILALQKGELPPTLNCDRPDPACGINVHRDGMRPVTKPHVLKLSFTELGQVAAVVLRRWDG